MTTAGLDGPLADALVGTPPLLHHGRGLATTCRSPAPPGWPRRPTTSTGTGGATTRSCARTHGVNCTGSCSWKVYVKDGIITWETQQTDYPSVGPDRPEYEPRGCPRGAAFSWYTYSPTRVRYPYVRGVLLADVPRGQGAARRRPGRWPGRTIVENPRRAPRPTSRPAARAGWSAPRGRRPSRSSPRPTSTRSRSTGPTGSPASRRSRRCRWSPTPPVPGSSSLIGGSMLSLLRLVRRPARRLAAGLRRPDRRPGVGRLVGRRLPDHVGLQRPGDPHPGRALDDRGPLPRPEGRRGRARTTPTT